MATKSPKKLQKTVKGRSTAALKTTPQEIAGTGQRRVRIIGFGASAGGLEAFSEVLAHMPLDIDAALVFVQHLDPKHSSVLTELLARVTILPVAEVRDKVKVQPNHVYVIPPNTNLLVNDGELRLTQRAQSGQNMPVDMFFRSLAEKQGSNAIGVILSGTASDGTLGLKAIKAEGGITLCQDPESAKYDGMPRSAIAAGCVDFVLRPSAMAKELVHLCTHPSVPQPHPKQDEDDLPAILSLLRSGAGVDFTFYKDATIRRRIQRRMALNHVDTTEEYVNLLRTSPEEVQALFQDILIKVTGFFRESTVFDFLKARVFPGMFGDRDREDPIRVWVSGCSTGEEAYSVGIVLLEYMQDHGLQTGVQIFGTDLSETALEKARAGIYPESIAGDVSEERLRKFFVKVNGSYQIARSVRDLCIFARQNLTKDPPFSKLDLITCRNVLIYLGPVLQQRLMRVFHYALKPAGFLVIGLSESTGSASDLFQQVDRKHKVYARKNAAVAVGLNFGPYEESRLTPATKTTHTHFGEPDLPGKIDQLLLSRYCPPGVLIDADLKILQFRGSTAPYLEHATGAADLDLLKMGRSGLGAEVRKLVKKARLKDTTVRGDALQLGRKGSLHQVRLSVTPIHGGSPEPQFLVVFEELTPPETAGVKHGRKTEKGSSSALTRRFRDLETELSSTKRYLQSVIEEQEATTEELKSANEEIQSSNEELQSTNEELLTAKEELQSTNEELTTVNEEMQGRNTELAQVNNDLNNLLSSVNIPIVMVGNDLRLRRFTPHAEKVLNLLPTDVGRPVGDFRPKINVPDLQRLFTDVIDHLIIREREVQDQDGRTYSMWIRPYRTTDHKIDGAVMTLFDITDRKTMTDARYRRLFEAARDGILIAEAGPGKVLDVNPFLTTLLGCSRMELAGKPLSEVGIFIATDLQEIATATETGDTWRRSTTLTGRTGEPLAVEIVANGYTEGDNHLLQFNIRKRS